MTDQSAKVASPEFPAASSWRLRMVVTGTDSERVIGPLVQDRPGATETVYPGLRKPSSPPTRSLAGTPSQRTATLPPQPAPRDTEAPPWRRYWSVTEL